MVFALLTWLLGGAWTPGDDGATAYRRSVLALADDGTRLALRDLDGDGGLDVVFVRPEELAVRYLRPDGTYPDEHDALLPLSGDRLAWCLVDVDGDGSTEVAMHREGREVRVYAPDAERRFESSRLLLEAPADLPHGTLRMRFFRDVDGDGRLDVVLPAFGHFAIYRQRDDGTFDAPIQVALQADVAHDVADPEDLAGRFGQRVRIPWFRLQDVDGDGRLDLVAETDDEVLFHLAGETSGLAPEPTWRLDLAALRSELPADEGFDLEDILSVASRGVSWRVVDLDGEGAHELLVQMGGKFRIYRSGARTGPVGTPQVLKSSGNVLFFFLRDVEGDPLPELQILRAGKLSIARVLRWLILPGKLDFDLFTYRNEAGVFSRKPTRRNVVSLHFPRLLAFAKDMEERESQLESLSVFPARRAALDADGKTDDLVDVIGSELVIYLGRAPEEEPGLVNGDDPVAFIEAFVLRELDEGGDGATKVIDLREIDEWGLSADFGLREICADLEPDRRVPLAGGLDGATIYVRDLDGDGRPDVLVVGKTADGDYVVQFLIGPR